MAKKPDWIKLKNEYLASDISLRRLATKHKISESTVMKRATREKWGEAKSQTLIEIDAKVKQKTQEAAVNEKIARNERHIRLYEQGLDVVEELLKQYMDELKANKKRPKATAYTIDFLMNALQKAQKGQRVALSMNDDDSTDDSKDVLVVNGIDVTKI
jgi:predicted DNA-binding protein YlxM (UPF0122 family)